MRTSTRLSPRLGRLAGAAAILFVPMAVLLAVLLARVDDVGGGTPSGTLGLSFDAQTAVRIAVATGLAVAGVVVAGTLLRRR